MSYWKKNRSGAGQTLWGHAVRISTLNASLSVFFPLRHWHVPVRFSCYLRPLTAPSSLFFIAPPPARTPARPLNPLISISPSQIELMKMNWAPIRPQEIEGLFEYVIRLCLVYFFPLYQSRRLVGDSWKHNCQLWLTASTKRFWPFPLFAVKAVRWMVQRSSTEVLK